MPDNELSLPQDSSTTDALLAIASATEGPQRLPFPVVQVSGGNGSSAGQFGPLAGTPDDVALKLPAGRGTISGIFVGYRTEVIAWATGYLNRDPESDGRPAWQGVLNPQNADDARLVADAVAAYQFTPNKDKGAFDPVGHARPSLQLLMFLPKLNDLVVIQAPAHQQTWALTTQSLKRLIDPQSKVLGQFPCTVKPQVDDRKANGFEWKVTSLVVSQLLTDESKAWWDSYQAWREQVKLDPNKVATVREWLSGQDRPITDEIRSKLQAVAALAPKRDK